MNKKLIISLSTIAAVAIVAIGATTAYFSNTETSTGNMFIAGAIDLKVDNECHLNGRACIDGHWEGTDELCDCTWEVPIDLDGKAIFYFDDIKPGDDGEDTISLHVDSNPAWVCVEVTNVTSTENGCNVPEEMVDPSCEEDSAGELWEYLRFSIWMDDNCDNILNGYEYYLVENAQPTDIQWAIADAGTGTEPITNACIGVAWSVPDAVGNIIQGDSVTGDITFYAYQYRNNENFICYAPPIVCGNGEVEEGEECEPPGEINCSYCIQSTSQCEGPKLQIRDAYGDCDQICGCEEDPWSAPVCDVATCDAQCDSNDDCDDQNPVTTDTCNMDECTCENVNQKICGDGDLDPPGEQCEPPGETNCSYCGQSTSQCDGYKTQTRDEYGDCNPYCGCVEDPWSDPVCVVDSCDAECAVDEDCDDHYICTNDCTCEYVPYCGDGEVNQDSEECDDGGNDPNDYCSADCKKQAKITVTKTVTNDDGGDLGVEDFNLLVDTTGVASGVPIYVLVGNHIVSEAGVFGYMATISGDCASDGSITLAWEDDKSCSIENDDIRPSITVTKVVNGGSAAPDDFDVSIDHVIKTSGSSNPVTANTAHIIDEEYIVPGYSFTSITGTSYLGVSCPAVLEGTITLLPGDVVTCTITNTY